MKWAKSVSHGNNNPLALIVCIVHNYVLNHVRKVRAMPKMKPTEDIQPLTVFRANVASFVDQVRETKRPLYLTQHGKSAAVLLSTTEYEALVEELEILRDVQASERELAEGRGVSHERVAEELRQIVRARSQNP